MIPLMMFCGLSQTYFFGQFPPLIHDKGDKFFVLAVFGASDMIGSYLVGKGSDRFGRLPMIMS
jgi:MFS family permease